MGERKCCYLEGGKIDGASCGANAAWSIYGSDTPSESVDSCTKHVGDLLDDSPVISVYPINPD